MISVRNRDARKGLGLGFGGGGGGREMEETELEEGEACSSHNNDDYDANVDPDVALSYLDEKLQDVLGHFQKDFEGGVSAENLGLTYGGYGSFLHPNQRSPVWSHPRTPSKVQNYNALRSPNNLPLEGGRYSYTVSSTAPQSMRPGPASSSAMSLPALKAPSMNDLVKQEICMPSTCGEEFTTRHEVANKKPANFPDQKTLKVRIKVGLDNLSTQKNAAIYSGLGLDVSPSSSLDDSPSESEGMHREPVDAPFESPSDILQIMTSFPVGGGQLLSPLSDDLIHLTEKEKLPKDSRSTRLPGGGPESSLILVNGSDYGKGDGKVSGQKKAKSVERIDFSGEWKSGSNRNAPNGTGVIPKEVDIDTLACEELVSKTLKLPLLSNSSSTVGDTGKGMGRVSEISRETHKSVVGDKVFSDLEKEEPFEPICTKDIDCNDNPMAGSAGKVWEDKKGSSLDELSLHQRKGCHSKGEKTYDSAKADSNFSKGRKALNTEPIDPCKPKVNCKATSHEQYSKKLPHRKEHSTSGGKKKSKGAQSHGTLATEVPKESPRVVSSLVPGNKKKTHADHYATKRELEDCKLQKDIGKAEDRYRDFFGDMVESEQEENRMNSLEMRSEDRLKDSGVFGKSSSTIINETSKERTSDKKFDKFSASETYSKAAPNVASHSGNGLISDAAHSTTAPIEMNENWVCCDMCQKWRLLPRGTNTDNLPDNWLCSMLDWLPGMNRCSVSEEETTNALRANCQVPAPVSQNNLHSNPGGVISGLTIANVHHPDQNYQTIGSHAMANGKKKLGLKEISNATNKDGPTQLSNSMKKNMQASAISGSLNDVSQSPMISEPFRQLSKSTELPVEKHRHKQKEKHKVLEHNSDGGNTKNSKMKSKSDPDRDCFRASKKIKTENMHLADEGCTSDHGVNIGKGGPTSSNGLPTTSAVKDQPRYKDRSSSKDSKSDTKDRLHVSANKTKDRVQVSMDEGSLDLGNCDDIDVVTKKRKAKECHDTQIYSGSLPNMGNHLQDSRVFVEEFSENDYRREKKARVSKSEGKDSGVIKGNGKTNKRGGHTKNQQPGQDLGSTLSQRSLDGMDSLKRDFGSAQPSVAATSSSSKVSGSHKTKASFHEAKGSPVESVSSSPMRISHSDKLASARRNLKGKDESRGTGLCAIGSPQRCSDGEDDGGSDRSGTARKDKTFTVAHHGSLESPMLDFQDKDFSHLSKDKAKAQIVPSDDIAKRPFTNGGADSVGKDGKPKTLDQCRDDERQNENYYNANGSRPRKSGKESSSRSKDKNWSFRSDYINELQDCTPSYEVKPRDGKSKFQEKFGEKSHENENRYFDKKDSAGKLSGESGKRESQSNLAGHDGPDAKVDVICIQDVPIPKPSLVPGGSDEKPSRRFVSDKTDQLEIVRRKSLSLPPSGGAQNETLARSSRPVSGSHNLAVDASQGDNALKVPKQIRKVDHQNGIQHISSRHATTNGHRIRDLDAPSPARKDPSSQAANNALKEAKDLKHRADRLKNSGSNLEGTWLYFQAALKFLHGASLLESCSSDSTKNGEMIQSMQIYSSTAKLCEFCAHEYEKSKDMATAALAYKCMEIAYMRAIYSSHTSVSRDRQELQAALQMVPPGESPSSSASDVDNLNHPTVDKAAFPKCVSSPQVTGNHVIAARHRPNFVRLLHFAQDVNFAMEASRKSRIAFEAANVSLGEAQYREGISSIRAALDFNFQDVEGLLRLVRLAMDAISR